MHRRLRAGIYQPGGAGRCGAILCELGQNRHGTVSRLCDAFVHESEQFVHCYRRATQRAWNLWQLLLRPRAGCRGADERSEVPARAHHFGQCRRCGHEGRCRHGERQVAGSVGSSTQWHLFFGREGRPGQAAGQRHRRCIAKSWTAPAIGLQRRPVRVRICGRRHAAGNAAAGPDVLVDHRLRAAQACTWLRWRQ